MDQTLIRNWNQRVKPEDVCFHCGDFCFKGTKGSKPGEGELYSKSNYYEKQLNGKIILIRGNHDKSSQAKTPIESMKIFLGGRPINLVHDPEKAVKSMINLCGHVHGAWKFKKLPYPETPIINVGVDVWQFRPIEINEILAYYQKVKNKLIDGESKNDN